MPLVIFMRHGQADNNVSHMLVGRHLESHLTEFGKQQVREAAQQLQNIPISRVIVSPVTRAVETAEIVCNTIGTDYEIDERLYEIELGKLVGMNYEEVVTKYGNLFLKFYDGHDPVLSTFGVEPFMDVKMRVKSLLDEVAAKYADTNVLCVTHLDPIKAAISTLLDLKPEALYRWHIRNASLTVLKQESKEYFLTGVNLTGIHRYLHE